MSQLSTGDVRLSEREAHHARDVLRLGESDEIELFDDAGQTAHAVVRQCDANNVIVSVEWIAQAMRASVRITVASAVPKGDRADWLVEKLSELGVDRFIPLQTERSVVLPTGKGKRDRWLRLAVEAAKQSRRAGVMQIDELTRLSRAIETAATGWFFTTEGDGAISIAQAVERLSSGGRGSRRAAITESTTGSAGASPSSADAILLLIGPEGGWTTQELDQMRQHNLTPVRLTTTILRIETAAIAAAAIVAAMNAK